MLYKGKYNIWINNKLIYIWSWLFFVISDIGICTCDLTANGCDVNCCCDKECSSEDRAVFSECEDQVTVWVLTTQKKKTL